jgi:ATP-dependent DNA ligase
MSLRERTRPGLEILEPCLPSPAKAPPSGPGWLHEIKHDGFRILARRDAAGVRLITRAGNDFSGRFPFIAMAVGKLPVRSGRSAHWVKVKNPKAPALKREAEEDWGALS